jgi:hypothetical protein
MMPSRRVQSEASLRAEERRRAEDAAERLITCVPRLATLEIAFAERREHGAAGYPDYVRRVVVERAPALFWLRCAEERCKDGGHDVTSALMMALRKGLSRVEGEHTCDGTVGMGSCGRVLRFVSTATWRP